MVRIMWVLYPFLTQNVLKVSWELQFGQDAGNSVGENSFLHIKRPFPEFPREVKWKNLNL